MDDLNLIQVERNFIGVNDNINKEYYYPLYIVKAYCNNLNLLCPPVCVCVCEAFGDEHSAWYLVNECLDQEDKFGTRFAQESQSLKGASSHMILEGHKTFRSRIKE